MTCLTLGLLLVGLAPTLSYCQRANPRITRIDVQGENIFRNDEMGFLPFVGKFVNKIHVQTGENIIRRELLYGEGDILDSVLIRESERNLRSLSFIGDVSTEIHRMNDSEVTVLVHADDKWSMHISPSYRQGNGMTAINFSVGEDNFLGQGISLGGSYGYRSDFPTPFTSEVILGDRRVLGSHYGVIAQYKDGWEQAVRSIQFYRPFYADEATWAGSAYFESKRVRYRTFQDGRVVNTEEARRNGIAAWISTSLGEQLKWRPALAFFRVRTDGSNLQLSDNLNAIALSVSFMQRSFKECQNLDGLGRTEDVPYGLMCKIEAGKIVGTQSADAPSSYLSLLWQHASFLARSWYVGYRARLDGYLRGGQLDNATIESSIVQHLKASDRHVLVSRISATIGIGWPGTRQVFLDGQNGLRGYPEFGIEGKRRLIWSIEDRINTGVEAWIFRFGTTIFVDGGMIDPFSRGMERMHCSCGLGLRIENTKQEGGTVVRVEFPYSFDRRSLSDVIISASLLFSAFQTIDFVAPALPDRD